MAKFNPTDITFNNVVDLFIRQRRMGNLLTTSMLAKAFPHLAVDIRKKLPAVIALDGVMTDEEESDIGLEGTVLGECEIIRELGRGAMGVVYEAVQLALGRHVALKVIPLGAESHSLANRFELERRAMARLEHPNIVPVFTYGCNDKYAYLVMRLIDGKSLDNLHLGEGDYRMKFLYEELKSDWQTLAAFGANVASGLQHAHENGMVHRDIKPGNLLLDRDGKVWITDFGLAKLVDHTRSLSQSGDIIGTPRYMAPEQLRGHCDARSDVYSLGLTLYELAAGTKVWSDRRYESIIANRGSITLEDLQKLDSDVPAGLATIIMRACQFDPEARYQTAGELQTVLQRFSAGHTLGDRRRRKRDPDHIFLKKRRRRRIATTSAVIATTIAAVAVYELNAERDQLDFNTNTVEAHRVSDRDARSEVAGVNLIDRLADDSDDDMVEIVSNFVSETIEESSKKMNLSTDAREQLHQQVNRFTDKISDEGLSKESLNSFLRDYRQSSLPAATRVMRVTSVVQQSDLTDEEKQLAIGLLRQFASAVATRALQEGEAMWMISRLSHDALDAEKILTLKISGSKLRNWLNFVHERVSQIPVNEKSVEAAYGELEQVINRSLGP